MRSRFLNELSTTDIEGYLSKGGDIALLPVGSVEMHGPHMPTGTDVYVAKAFALRLAEKADAIVLPEIGYTWAGATDGFPGTISVEPELVLKVADSVISKVIKMGFKRLVIVNAHGPNNQVFYFTARRNFEMGQPILLIDVAQPFSEEARNIQPEEDSMLLAALKILNLSHLYPEKDIAYEDTAPPLCNSFSNLKKTGVIGYFFQDSRQHVTPNSAASSQKGLDYIDLQVKSLLPALEDLSIYIDEAKVQRNKGWWRI